MGYPKSAGAYAVRLSYEQLNQMWAYIGIMAVLLGALEAICFYYIRMEKRKGRKEEEEGRQSADVPPEGAAAAGPEVADGENGQMAKIETNGGGDICVDQIHLHTNATAGQEVEKAKKTEEESLLPRFMPAVEGLRVWGAIHVLLYHVYSNVENEECNFCRLGSHWVEIFFVITGLVSYKSASRGKTPAGGYRYMTRRMKRLWPISIVSIAVCYVGSARVNQYYTSHSVLNHILLIQSFDPADSALINPSLWFVSNLVVFWLLIPHWAFSLKRSSPRALCAMGVIVAIASLIPHICYFYMFDLGDETWAYSPERAHEYPLYLARLMFFNPISNWKHIIFGMLIATYLERSTDKFREYCERFGATVGTVTMVLIFLLYDEKYVRPKQGGYIDTFDIHEFLWKGPFIYGLLFVLFIGTSQSRDLASRVLIPVGKVLGKYALPIFVLHVPAYSICSDLFGWHSDLLEVYGQRKGQRIFDYVLYPSCMIIVAFVGGAWQTWWEKHLASAKKKE